MTFSITTFRKLTLSIMGSFATLSSKTLGKIDIQHNVSAVMMSVVLLNVIMLSVVVTCI